MSWGAPRGFQQPCRPGFGPAIMGPGGPWCPAPAPNYPRFTRPQGNRGRGPNSWTGSHGGFGPSPRFQGCSPHFNVPGPQWQGAPLPRGRGGHHLNRPNFNEQRGKTHGFQHQGGMNKKSKKPRVDKRELPENNKFYCDICDRGFKTEETYTEHVRGHVRCTVEGCSYIAAAKLVSLHYNMQHKTGLAKKIWQLESKEDVEKWRNERKKNFPTAQVVAQKKAIQENKIARGEILETKYFGKFKNNRAGRGRGRRNDKRLDFNQNANSATVNQNQQKRQHGPDHVNKHGSPTKRVKIDTVCMVEKQKNPNLDPLSYVLPEGELGSDDDSDENQKTVTSNQRVSNEPESPEHPLVAGGLGTLISAYNTDSSEPEEDPPNAGHVTAEEHTAESPMTRPKLSPNDNKNKRRKRNTRRGKKRGKGQGSNQGPHEALTRARKSTLLEKLLAPEIRQERNVILQCVRYIVKQRFFGVGAQDGVTKLERAAEKTDEDETNRASSDVDDVKQDTLEESSSAPLNHSDLVDDEIWENCL